MALHPVEDEILGITRPSVSNTSGDKADERRKIAELMEVVDRADRGSPVGHECLSRIKASDWMRSMLMLPAALR